MDLISHDRIYCSACHQVIAKSDRYCPKCGGYQNFLFEQAQQEKKDERWKILKGVIIFYSIYLASVIPLYWMDENFFAETYMAVLILDVFIILWYRRNCRIPILPQLQINPNVWRESVWGILLLVPLLALNLGYHRFFIHLFDLQSTKMTDPFIEKGYGIGIVVFASCIMPAVWEEIAFRGLLQSHLLQAFPRRETIIMTAALFAIIHASLISWPYLFLFGILLGVLRLRSRSLWPVILVHFLHNLAVTIREFYF